MANPKPVPAWLRIFGFLVAVVMGMLLYRIVMG